MKSIERIFAATAVCAALGCGGSTSMGGSGASSFNLGVVARDVAPVLRVTNPTEPPPNAATAALNYGAAADWGSVRPMLLEILGDPNEDPRVVTKMHILLDMAGQVLSEAVSAVYENAGVTDRCIPIPSNRTPRVPWFTDRNESPFFDLADGGAYQCLYRSGSMSTPQTLVGRTPVANAPADCADPHRYAFMTGGSTLRMPNMEDIAQRGQWVSRVWVLRGAYDRCSGDLKVVFAHITEYESGVRFGSRSEITGNSRSHQFALRSIKLDTVRDPQGQLRDMFGIVQAAGASQTSGNDRFIVSYQRYEDVVRSTSMFCMAVTPTQYAYEPATAGCDGYEATYGAIPPISPGALPTAPFPIDFGVGN